MDIEEQDSEMLGDMSSRLVTEKESEAMGHRRNESADSGLSLSMSWPSLSKANAAASTTVHVPSADAYSIGTRTPMPMDLSQEMVSSAHLGDNEELLIDLDMAMASNQHETMNLQDKLAKYAESHGNNSTSDQSVDSGVGCSRSRSMEIEDQVPNDLNESLLSRSDSLAGATASSVDEAKTKMDLTEVAVSSAGEDSPDYPESLASEAVQPFYSTLEEIISNQVDQFASELYSRALIGHEVLSELQPLGNSQRMKASKLLHPVMSKLRLCRESNETHEPFEVFVEVLEKYQCCHDVATQIRAKYKEQKQKALEHETLSKSHDKRAEKMVCCHPTTPSLHSPSPPNSSIYDWNQPSLFSASFNTSKVCAGANYERQNGKQSSLTQQLLETDCDDIDVNMSEEDIQHEIKKLHRGSKRLARGIENLIRKKLDSQSIAEKKLHYTEVKVEELQQEVGACNQELERCNEAKEVLKAHLRIARKQILQLNKEVISLKRPQPQACAVTCQHRLECGKLERLIKRMEEEKLEYIATIENLTQQRELLLAT